VELTATALVGEENRMFGAITAANIADLLAEQGIPIDRRTIELEEPIKALGVYNVSIRLHTDVSARVKVKVVAEEKKVE